MPYLMKKVAIDSDYRATAFDNRCNLLASHIILHYCPVQRTKQNEIHNIQAKNVVDIYLLLDYLLY